MRTASVVFLVSVILSLVAVFSHGFDSVAPGTVGNGGQSEGSAGKVNENPGQEQSGQADPPDPWDNFGQMPFDPFGSNGGFKSFPSSPMMPDEGFFEDFGNLFREMDNLRRRMHGSFFDRDPFGKSYDPWPGDDPAQGFTMPEIDFRTKGDTLYITIESEGLEKGEVNVSVMNNSLVVSSNRKKEEESSGKNGSYHRFTAGSFRRVVPLPVLVDEKNLKTSCGDGKIIIEARILSARNPMYGGDSGGAADDSKDSGPSEKDNPVKPSAPLPPLQRF